MNSAIIEQSAQSSAQMQNSNATRFNRYPDIFRTIQAHQLRTRGNDLGGSGLRILSFGCSTGEEIQSLRAYFPDAAIMGCDINSAVLTAAREQLIDDPALVFESNPRTLQSHGPYDVIICGSVLCSYPLGEGTNDLTRAFPFSRFADALGSIDENLTEGGLLAVYNSNYFVSDLDLFANYGAIRSPLIEANGFVDKFCSDGMRCTSVVRGGGRRTYAHSVLSQSYSQTDADFRDSLFIKGQSVSYGIGTQAQLVQDVPRNAKLILGLDPWKYQQRSLVAAGLYRWEASASDGAAWIGQSWLKSSLEHDAPQSFGTYWARAL